MVRIVNFKSTFRTNESPTVHNPKAHSHSPKI